ncbi:MAG: hypothetical protein WB580_03595 [Candidatus Binataceae bacterium]
MALVSICFEANFRYFRSFRPMKSVNFSHQDGISFPTIVKDTSKFLREQEATSVPGRLRMAGKIKAPAAAYADAESEERAR